MASIRNLKKEINYVLSDIIEAVYIWELTNPEKGTKKSEALIDETIDVFDELITKINLKDIDNQKQHFKSINQELDVQGRKLIDKINAIS